MKTVVVLGGGSGTSESLRALAGFCPYPCHLQAIVSMADNGGSTGILRNAYGVLPPGDVRQCLAALSTAPSERRAWFDYRFPDGPLKGHAAGNLVLASLEKSTGSFEDAISVAARLLDVRGEVIPVTLDNIHEWLRQSDGTIVMGQYQIDHTPLHEPWEIFLEPTPTANPEALMAIRGADAIVIGPGSFVTSILPVLAVNGICAAIRDSAAKLIFNVNLVTTPGHSDGWTATRFVRELERHLERRVDVSLCNVGQIPEDLLVRNERGAPVVCDLDQSLEARHYIATDLCNKSARQPVPGDPIQRGLIRHDSELLGRALWDAIINR